MSVGLAVVVDLVASLPDSRDRSLGTQAPPKLGPPIWATITLLTEKFTRSNLSQNLFLVSEVLKVLAKSHPTVEQVQDLIFDNCRRVVSRILRFYQNFRKGF